MPTERGYLPESPNTETAENMKPNPTFECDCAKCASACARIPGIFTPLEALKAVRAGYADDMMLRWVDSDELDDRRQRRPDRRWEVLMPRSASKYDRTTPKHHRSDGFNAIGRCVLLDVDQRCAIHDSGFKPIECREALSCDAQRARGSVPGNDHIKLLWESWMGRTVIQIWETELQRSKGDRRGAQAKPKRGNPNLREPARTRDARDPEHVRLQGRVER